MMQFSLGDIIMKSTLQYLGVPPDQDYAETATVTLVHPT